MTMPAPPTDPPDPPARVARLDAVAVARTRRRLWQGASVPWLHEEAARRMAERLPLVRLQPAQVLDWSGPLGRSVSLLRAAYPSAAIAVVDLPGEPAQTPTPAAQGVRRWWPWRRGAEAAAHQPEAEVAAGSAELVWANMQLQSLDVVEPCFERWHRALAVGGFLMFSCFGPGSLPELRALYQRRGWGVPFAPHIDMHDLGDALVQAGFADPVMDQELLTLTWPDVDAALRELRGLGANVSPQRHAGLRTPRWLAQLRQELLTAHARDGRPALSFELVYGHAFKAAPRARVQSQTEISLDAMRAMMRAPRP